jgi:hypothetical protein
VPTQIKVTRIRTKTPAEDSRVKLSMSFAFDADDPAAADVYRGLSLMLGAVLTQDEVREFMTKLEKLRRNPRGGEVSGTLRATRSRKAV